MDKRKKNIWILVVLLVGSSTLGFLYWAWVQTFALPILGEIAEYETETISDDKYTFERGKIRIVSFVSSRCNEECDERLSKLADAQNELINGKIFVSRVEIVSIVEDRGTDKNVLKDAIEHYSINEDGWKFLYFPNEELENFKQKMNESKENNHPFTLVDANNKIRQHYALDSDENMVQLMKDVKQLIRIQQQSIEEKGK